MKKSIKTELSSVQKTLDEYSKKKATLEARISKNNKQKEIIDATIKNTQSAYEKIVETSSFTNGN